jgi:transcription elongation regulator 1
LYTRIPSQLLLTSRSRSAPNGTAYYYNNLTKQSTYTRPLPSGVAPSFPPPSIPQTIPQSVVAAPPKKKEKPKEKIPIPGTNWTKVITSENNVFYAEKGTKKSSWTVPEEIKEAVEAYEADLKTQAIRKEEELRLKKEDDRQAEIKERERIRLELEEERINKIEAEKKRKRELDKERERKRKEREGEDDEEEQGDEDRPSKMAKVNGVEKTASEVDEDEEQAAMGPVDEDDEAAWQAAVAAEIAKENKEKDKQKKEKKAAKKAEEEQAKAMVFHAPAAVELNPDEGKALFKVGHRPMS